MKILHLTEKIYTGTACGACDKYEVWSGFIEIDQFFIDADESWKSWEGVNKI